MQIHCALDWSIRFFMLGLITHLYSLDVIILEGYACDYSYSLSIELNSSHPIPSFFPSLTWLESTSHHVNLGTPDLLKFSLSILVSSLTHPPMIFKHKRRIMPLIISKLGWWTDWLYHTSDSRRRISTQYLNFDLFLSKLGGGTSQRSFALYISIKLKRKAELHIHIRYLVLQHKLVWDPQIRPLAVARDKECPLKLIRLLMNVTWGVYCWVKQHWYCL